MATDYTDAEAQKRRRVQYNREIWSGGIAFLLLLVLLMFAMLHPGLRAVEPFLGFGIALVAVMLGCYLIVVSHRDAQLAQNGISPEKAVVRSTAWSVAAAVDVFACIAAVIAGILLPSPAVVSALISTAVIIIAGQQLLPKILKPYSDKIENILKIVKDRIRQRIGMDRQS